MEYSKADRRAVIVLALIASGIIAGIVLFGQREQSMVSAPALPNDFLKAFKDSKISKAFKDYKDFKAPKGKPCKPYQSYSSYSHYSSYNEHRHSEYSEQSENSDPSRPSKFSQPTTVDINSADTMLLQRIPGIGSNIARWIVQRRERLGGFYSVEQLLEVRYVEPAMLQWFTVDTALVHRFRIGDMTFAEMSRHPYIGYEKAKAISNYQRLYGPISDMEQLRATAIFTDEELERLQNYIF